MACRGGRKMEFQRGDIPGIATMLKVSIFKSKEN